MYNIGDLVIGVFGQALAFDYGYGIIIKRKKLGRLADRIAYRVHWSKYHQTWEPERGLALVVRIND